MRQEHATDEVGEQNTLKGAESSDLLANFRIIQFREPIGSDYQWISPFGETSHRKLSFDSERMDEFIDRCTVG